MIAMKSPLSLLLSFFLLVTAPAWADSQSKDLSTIAQWQKDNLTFTVQQLLVGKFFWVQESLPSPAPEQNPLLFAVTIEFFNGNTQRKTDLVESFEFQLVDEFKNQYRVIPLRENGATIFPKDEIPKSLYPGRKYRKTVFFEAPLNTSKTLTLTIRGNNLSVNEPIVLAIATKYIREWRPRQVARFPSEDDFQVIGPELGAPIFPGAVVHIGVRVPKDVRAPSGVYIISPNYVFEDADLRYQYDVRIPRDQPLGPFVVVVMARWGQTNEIVLSKSITLQIVDKPANKNDTPKDYVD
jgi:hypothetical protein